MELPHTLTKKRKAELSSEATNCHRVDQGEVTLGKALQPNDTSNLSISDIPSGSHQIMATPAKPTSLSTCRGRDNAKHQSCPSPKRGLRPGSRFWLGVGPKPDPAPGVLHESSI
jgi:hypothetical protein